MANCAGYLRRQHLVQLDHVSGHWPATASFLGSVDLGV